MPSSIPCIIVRQANMKALGAKERVNLLFRAFSDPTRLRILHLLRSEDALCVGDLVAILRVPQPTASRPLSDLRRAGVVATRKDGPWIFYALAPARGPVTRNSSNASPAASTRSRLSSPTNGAPPGSGEREGAARGSSPNRGSPDSRASRRGGGRPRCPGERASSRRRARPVLASAGPTRTRSGAPARA